MKLKLSFVLYLLFSLTAIASSDLASFQRQIDYFCGIKSKKELKRVKVDLTYYACTDKSTGEVVPILDFAEKMDHFMRVEASKKPLLRICKAEYRDVWDEKGYAALTLNADLPSGECICDLMKNDFEETKEAICPSEGKNPAKDLVNNSLEKTIGINSIQMEREVERLNDEAKYYGIENFCPEFKDISCASDIEDYLSRKSESSFIGDGDFDSLSGKYKNPKTFLEDINPKNGKFFKPKLEINSVKLKEMLVSRNKLGKEQRDNLLKINSLSGLNNILNRRNVAHHTGEMYDLRKNIKNAGNSLEKYLISSKAVKAENLDAALKSFCLFDPKKDSEKLLEIKEKIFTHDAISFKSCADSAGKGEVQSNSKQIISLLNKSSKNLDTKPLLADAIEEELRKEFLEDMPRRCGLIKDRAELICKLPTMKPKDLLALADEVEGLSDSRNSFIDLIGEGSVANANTKNELMGSLSCFLGNGSESIGLRNQVGVPPGHAPPTAKEEDRTVAEQVAEHERKISELLIASKIAKEVAEVRGNTPLDIRDSSQNYRDFVADSNQRVSNIIGRHDARGLDVTKSDFYDRIGDLRTKEHLRFSRSVLDIQRSLVKKRDKIRKKLKDGTLSKLERRRLEKRLSSINTDIADTENLTNTKVADGEVYNFNKVSKSSSPAPVRDKKSPSSDGMSHEDFMKKITSQSSAFDPIKEVMRSELTLPTDISGKAKGNIHRRQNGGFATASSTSGRAPSSTASTGTAGGIGSSSSGSSGLSLSIVNDVGIYQVPNEQQEARVIETKEDKLRQKVTFVDEKKVMRVYELDKKGKYSLKGEYDRSKFKKSRESFINEVHHKAMVFFELSIQDIVETEL